MRQDNGIRIRRRKRLPDAGPAPRPDGRRFRVPTPEGLPRRPNPPPRLGPDRYGVTTVDYTKYFWWLIRWGENEVECHVEVDHEGLPTPGDIYVDCGEDVYDEWVTQEACAVSTWTSARASILCWWTSNPHKRRSPTKLQAPIVQVTLENCNPVHTSSTRHLRVGAGAWF
ncbi:MAG: hypothetical protein MZV64_19865 [Ignavibacteriales bacterium]|nr:hypothetical protein [Ignavibacteriales bacterium]